MFETLRNLNDQDALLLLSATAQSLLPDPGVGSRVTDVLNAPAKSREQLLQELRHKLKLSQDDKSPRAQAEIFNTLSSEISKYALKNVDIRQVKARLGARGDLPPGSYDIDIDPAVRDIAADHGIRPNHIEDALHSPDTVQHLSDRHDFVSMFLKRVGSRREAFTLFVVAERDGYTLRVHHALRIYEADVNIQGVKEPLAVLRAFLNRYGLPVQIGPRSGLLLLDEVVPFAGTNKELSSMITVAGEPREPVAKWDGFSKYTYRNRTLGPGWLIIAHRNSRLSVAEIVIAYAYDSRKYNDDLRRHGVPVPTLK